MFESGIVVSIQPEREWYAMLAAYVREVAQGGAVAVRVRGAESVEIAKRETSIPVIGLTKGRVKEWVHITPAAHEAQILFGHGADYVAADATGRWGYEELDKMIALGNPIIGDISTVEEALEAEQRGCVAVTTALSGYTQRTRTNDYEFVGPDMELVEKCCKQLTIPVVAEGRYWTVKQHGLIRAAGAHALCVGASVCDPRAITAHWVALWTGEWKRKAR